jgi:hypothetical protein
MSEGFCNLEFIYKNEKTVLTLHPVEMWTYLVRYNPGLDGTSKKFFVTAELPENFFKNIRNSEIKNILLKIFENKNKVLFSFVAEASDQYFQMIPNKEGTKPNTIFFLTKQNSNISVNPEFYKATRLYEQPNVKMFLDESLLLQPKATYTIQNRSLIETKLERNILYKQFLLNELETFKRYKNKTIPKYMGPDMKHAEGFILGAGAKMFTIAGPVIAFGFSTGMVYGLIYWIWTMI